MGLILLAGILAYANSFWVPFLFDDGFFILTPMSRATFTPWWRSLLPPPHFEPWVHRPLVSLSLALNYNLGGTAVWGYHAVNLSIHLANGLLIFALLRRLFGRREALAVALLWIVHPLNTESVTYIYQRAESLMALFALLTLYCFTRAAKTPHLKWSLAAFGACAAGMLGKQTMVVVPVLALIYDRIFLSTSWKELRQRRGLLHLALIATVAIVPALLWTAGRHGLPSQAGFSFKAITPWQYARTEPSVILHYLRLSFSPHPLILDYAWPVESRAWVILLSSGAVAALAGLTFWALRRHPKWAFLGIWFFFILAPISSFVPSNDPAAEHRMYLPLVSVLALFAATLARLLKKRPQVFWGVIGTITVALGVLTFQRNLLYQDPALLWQDVVARRPRNERAWDSLAIVLHQRGELVEAAQAYRQVAALRPDFAPAYDDLGLIAQQQGNLDEAMAYYQKAIELKPEDASAYNHLGTLFIVKQDWPQSRAWFQKALDRNPHSSEIISNLGVSFEAAGNFQEALRCYEEALRLEPGQPVTLKNLQRVKAELGN